MAAARAARRAGPFVVVIMGVSGCGKTSVGEALARAWGGGASFEDGDAYHPQSNIDRMRRGQSLDDTHRWPWLRRLAAMMSTRVTSRQRTVVACSALKRSYRDVLRSARGGSDGGIVFVFLDGSRALIASRLASRKGHFFKPSLLDSQFATLERPGPSERSDVVIVSVEPKVKAIVRDILSRFGEIKSRL